MKFYLLLLGFLFAGLFTVKSSQLNAADHNTSTFLNTTQGDSRQLIAGDVVERDIAIGELHRYHLKLEAHQYLNVAVDQKGIDVLIAIYDPAGKKLAQFDSPLGTKGTEPVYFISPLAGDYELTISPIEQKARSGQYAVRVLSITFATERDKIYVEAKTLSAQAEDSRNQFTAESLRNAVSLYTQAIVLWKKISEPKEEAYVTHGLGRTQESLSQYSAAIETYQKAIPLWQAAQDIQGEGMTLSNLGLVYLGQADYANALRCIEQCLPLRQKAGDIEGEGYTQIIYATILNALGETDRAAACLEKTLGIGRSLQHKRLTGYGLYHLGVLAYNQNDLQRALDYQRESLELRRQYVNTTELAASLNQLGEIYYGLGDFQQSLVYLNEALAIARKSGNRSSEATVLESFGVINIRLGDYAKAEEYFNQALGLAKAIGDRSKEAVQMIRLGDVYAARRENQQALGFYEQALQLCRAIGNRQIESVLLFKIGGIQGQLKKYDDALKQLQAALELSRSLKENAQETEVLAAIARVEAAQGKLQSAKTKLEAALGMIENTRRNLRVNDLRAAFLATRRDLAEFYVDLLMKMKANASNESYAGQALLASEQFRARSLIDLLTESRAEIRDGANSELLVQERNVRQKISDKSEALRLMMNRKSSSDQAAAIEKELSALIGQLKEVQAQIRTKNPHYAALTQPQPLTLAEIQGLLESDTVLLEYLLGKERSFLWVVSKSEIASYELPRQTAIETVARRVYELFNRSHERAVRGQAQLAAAELSQMVLGPAAGKIAGKRLLIVADGALQYVPFAALPEPLTAERDTESGRKTPQSLIATLQPLITNHEIINLPSASVLPLLRQENSATAKNAVAIFADPVFQNEDQRVKLAVAQKDSKFNTQDMIADRTRSELVRSGSETGSFEFARLPYTRQEADEIFSLIGSGHGLKAIDFKASRATAINAELNQYRILHFATHGLLNSQHPELSGLVLSLVDENGQPQDGFLRLHDIYNLNLKADLVVLSACRTALGKEINGEGLIGLTRGFMYAGARSVIASLWDVRDEATAELMKRFYQNMLKQGQQPSAALRAAQISVMQDPRWAAAYFWAGFTMQGIWK